MLGGGGAGGGRVLEVDLTLPGGIEEGRNP